VFRRLLLAVCLAASMTLSGVSACSDSTSPCAALHDTCKDSNDCCSSPYSGYTTRCHSADNEPPDYEGGGTCVLNPIWEPPA